jgi:5-methylcytosine-specific restriction endonuclease McrA
MFVYCTEVLHLSEHEAYLRIQVARASRKHPVLLEMLEDGRLHLSGISVLHAHLTEANHKTLLKRAAHKSKRQILELVAEIAPKEDAPATMRRLPERREPMETTPKNQLGPDLVDYSKSLSERDIPQSEKPFLTPPASAPSKPAVLEPLAPAKYKIQFTASAELRDKLQCLQALMRSSVPDGDLATIIEEAVTEKLERLESKRFGKTKVPRKTVKNTTIAPKSRHIPAAVKRAVYERDQGRCTYIAPNGRRCSERHGLEFDHIVPYGRGGDHSVGNLRLACRAHNGYFAEREYGKKKMERYRRSASRVSEPAALYTSQLVPERGQFTTLIFDKPPP